MFERVVQILGVWLTVFAVLPAPTFARDLSVPEVRCDVAPNSYTEFITEYGSSSRGSELRCRSILSPTDIPGPFFSSRQIYRPGSAGDVAQVIGFSNERFKERGKKSKGPNAWDSPEFLKERLQIGEDYSQRSLYAAVKKPYSGIQYKGADPILGTVGLTYSYGTDDLPIQRSLNLESLPRPQTCAGLIMELRSFSKGRLNTEGIQPVLIAAAVKMVFAVMRDCPELYEQPILYLYADKLSQRFYTPMGFEIVKSVPEVEHDGTMWATMAVTPKRLEYELLKTPGVHFISDLNQPVPVTLPNGAEVMAAPGSSIQYIRTDGRGTDIYVIGESEIFPGVFVGDGGQIQIHNDNPGGAPGGPSISERAEPGWFATIDRISRPAYMPIPGVWIPAGSSLKVFGDGTILGTNRLSEAIPIPALSMTVNAGGELLYYVVKNRQDGTPAEEVEVAYGRRYGDPKWKWIRTGRSEWAPLSYDQSKDWWIVKPLTNPWMP